MKFKDLAGNESVHHGDAEGTENISVCSVVLGEGFRYDLQIVWATYHCFGPVMFLSNRGRTGDSAEWN